MDRVPADELGGELTLAPQVGVGDGRIVAAQSDRHPGLQFHLESTEESIDALIRHCGEEITRAPYIQDPPTIGEYADRLPETHALLDGLLDALSSNP